LEGGGYLRTGPRAFGISLVWKSTPVYHWRIRNEHGSNGAVIRTGHGGFPGRGEPISLYSKRYRASLVVGYEEYGVDLGWDPEPPLREDARRDWFITDAAPSGNEVIDGHFYRLLNRTLDRKIRYGEQTFGINLKFGLKEGVTNIRFEKFYAPGLPREGALRYGDLIAIHVEGGGYLRQAPRQFGIDLVWKSTPDFKWTLYGSRGSAGAIIRTGDRVEVYSENLDASLVNADQTFGVDLGFWLEATDPGPPCGENPNGCFPPDQLQRPVQVHVR
jgi:hypothetical protein